MMLFKTWGYITMAQALTFTSDFKLGHYMKIPPRAMFWSQVVATVIAGTVQLGVQAWMFTNIPDMCSPDQPSGFICPSTEVFGAASVIWGVIGPARQFSKGQIYYGGVFVHAESFETYCSALSSSLLLLPSRRHPTLDHIYHHLEVAEQLAQVPQLPSYIFWDGGHPTCVCC